MLGHIKIPSTVRTLSDYAFRYCENLKTVELQEGLEEIKPGCFESSSVEEIVIPSSVRRIGREAFCMCEHLKGLVFAPGSALERVGKYAFRSTKLTRDKVQLPVGAEIAEEAFGIIE